MEEVGTMTASAHQEDPQTRRIAEALEQLDGAVHELSLERKEAYLEAVRRVPELVAIESPPLRFVRFSRLRLRLAAARLAFYWESRLAIFGEERAFLPLMQPSEGAQGALDERDMVFLKSGYFLFLPDDNKGRSVLYTDVSRTFDVSQETCLRVAFYVWSVLSENERSQMDGHVSVALLGPQMDLRLKQCEEMVSVALPVRVKETYLLCCSEGNDMFEYLMTGMPTALEALTNLTENRETIYVMNTKAQLAYKMQTSGFPRSALPTDVGGSWSSRQFDEWLRQRSVTEMDRYARKKAPVTADPDEEQGGSITEIELFARKKAPVTKPDMVEEQGEQITERVLYAGKKAPVRKSDPVQEQGTPITEVDLFARKKAPLTNADSLRKQGDRITEMDLSTRKKAPVTTEDLVREANPIAEMDLHTRKMAPLPKADTLPDQGDPSTTTGQETANLSIVDTLDFSGSESSSPAVPLGLSGAQADAKYTPENSRKGHLSTEEKLREDLEEALGRIPDEEKRVYSEALERAPLLVRNDPDPVTFLQCENNDADAAARRVVRFWNLRREVFGERAFLPMDQTGSGALAPEDLEFLRTGFVQVLPSDEEGRNILCHLRRNLTPAMYKDESKKLRCKFYMAFVASESETTRRHGLVLLRTVDVDAFKLTGKMAQWFYSNHFPSRPVVGHSLISYTVATKKLVHETIVPSILGAEGEAPSFFVHTGISGRELADKLRPHGISKEGLPPAMGGTWTENNFLLWQKERVAIERRRAAVLFAADPRRTSRVSETGLDETASKKHTVEMGRERT